MPESRRNGFSPPFPALQICTWIYLPILMLEFLFFVSPILPVAASVPCTLLFFFFAFASAYYTYLACITDPMDVHLAKHLNETGELSSNETSTCCYKAPPTETAPEEELKYCWVCETSVADHSMHCKYCNKCVSHFDHHCLWLNTCVGNANYTYFYRILWTTCLMLVVHTCCMLGIVIDIFTGGASEKRANEWFGANLSGLVAGVNIFFIVSNVACLSAVAQLLAFHLQLQKKNLTTYQYIITDNARRREQFQKKEERRSNRVAAVSKARQEGQPVLASRLQMGQYCCSACDPLSDEETPADANGDGAADKNETELGYAELSDDMGGTSADEKTSMTSERDLARTLAASLGESSSSQLEPTYSLLEQKQEEEEDVTAENSTEDVTAENSKEESEPNGIDFVAVDTTKASNNEVVIAPSSNEVEEAADNAESKLEGEPIQEEPIKERAASDADSV